MINKSYRANLNAIGLYLIEKGWIYVLLILGLGMLYKLTSRFQVSQLMTVALFPLTLYFLIMVLKYSKKAFYVLFGLQFLLLVWGMFFDVKLGVFTLVLSLSVFVLFLLHDLYEKVDWTPARNIMFFLYLIWGSFCILEIANPNNVQAAWNIAITHYFVYPMICAIIVPLTIRNIKDIQWLLVIWSLFILIATAKGYWQKNYGFNERELFFLYELGGAKTHIIWSGIRYFSCFTDAANYGVHMAMAIVTFGISIFYTKNIVLKLYYLLIVASAIYGMGISGTRAAIAVPIAGIGLFILLSRNRKAAGCGAVVLFCFFLFFQFTTIGQGNPYIRKMRSAFNPTEDASYQTRINNREQISALMMRKPIGYGIGLSKGERFYPKERMPYPPDSWLVSVWVETGIVGILLYLLIHATLFAWCSYLLMFKIRDKQLRGLLTAWLCMNAGFFVAAYVNDVMQYPNPIIIYTGFALCLAGPCLETQVAKADKLN